MSAPGWSNGSVVELVHLTTDVSFTALVEKDKSQITFCKVDAPYEKLKVSQNDGMTSWGSGGGKFVPTFLDNHVTLQLCANQKKSNAENGEEGWYLGISSTCTSGIQVDKEYFLIGNASRQVFFAKELSPRAKFTLSSDSCYGNSLTSTQIASFCHEGYLVLRNAVPISLINEALRRINHELGKPGMMIEGGVEGAAKLAGNISNHPAILDLYRPISTYVESLIGAGCVVPPQGAQLALRFPEISPPYEPKGTEWHTDGMRQGKWNPFTLLVGVALSNTTAPQCGNLIVFPQSHRLLHEMLQEAHDGLLQVCVSSDQVWGNGQLPDLGPPVQLLLSKGDVVLAHPKTAHRGGPNFSPDIRYQIYYRIKHKNHLKLQENLKYDLYGDFYEIK